MRMPTLIGWNTPLVSLSPEWGHAGDDIRRPYASGLFIFATLSMHHDCCSHSRWRGHLHSVVSSRMPCCLLLPASAAAAAVAVCALQEEMYSFVTVAQEQSFKGKGTTVVQDS